jgi:hypothetical protein
VPDDIRILVRPVRSLNRWLTLFHELGHAMAHALNAGPGIYKTWTAAYDEAMAMLTEYIALSVPSSGINREQAGELLLLEGMECALSALFEFALWQDPASAERLYVEHYEQAGVRVVSPDLWAADSFRSLDPVYKQNFVLGILVARRTIRFLEQEYGGNFRLWGQWLIDNYYADGRRRSLREKTAIVGGLSGVD